MSITPPPISPREVTIKRVQVPFRDVLDLVFKAAVASLIVGFILGVCSIIFLAMVSI